MFIASSTNELGMVAFEVNNLNPILLVLCRTVPCNNARKNSVSQGL